MDVTKFLSLQKRIQALEEKIIPGLMEKASFIQDFVKTQSKNAHTLAFKDDEFLERLSEKLYPFLPAPVQLAFSQEKFTDFLKKNRNTLSDALDAQILKFSKTSENSPETNVPHEDHISENIHNKNASQYTDVPKEILKGEILDGEILSSKTHSSTENNTTKFEETQDAYPHHQFKRNSD